MLYCGESRFCYNLLKRMLVCFGKELTWLNPIFEVNDTSKSSAVLLSQLSSFESVLCMHGSRVNQRFGKNSYTEQGVLPSSLFFKTPSSLIHSPTGVLALNFASDFFFFCLWFLRKERLWVFYWSFACVCACVCACVNT